MKTTFIPVFFLCFSHLAAAQNAWQDAVELNKYFEFDPVLFRAEVDNSTDVNEEAIMQIVARYCPEAVVLEDGQIKVILDECFQGNPFISLQQYAQQNFSNAVTGIMEGEGSVGVPDSRGGGRLSGGSFITNLADGLAIFLVKRTKEELNAAFFEGLRKAMDQEPAYRALFPATFDLLYVIGSEIYNYNAYIETLREGFVKDLKVLPMSVREFSLSTEFIKKPEYRIVLEDLLGASQMLIDAKAPAGILDFFATSASLQDSLRWPEIQNDKTRHAVQDMAMSIRTLRLMANSMADENGTWIASEDISAGMRDLSHTYLYLGLLWQQGHSLRFSNGTEFRGVLGKMATMTQAPLSLRNYLVSLAQTGKLLEKSFTALLVKSDSSFVLNDEYLRFAGLVFDLLEHTRSFRQQVILPDWKIVEGKPVEFGKINFPTAEADTMERKVFTVLRSLFDLEFNVRQEHYTLAVANLTRLLTEILSEDDFKFKKQFLRHANFIANVAEARNSQEVAAAIELFALPPGSSRMKKQSDWSVSLNSYGGIAAGWENDLQEEVNDALEDKNVVGTYAPLGIDFNIGLHDAGSISFFTQVVDVGAVFAYRFSNQTERIPDLKFENIIAPGFYTIYGFGNNIPVSVGVGAQLGPNLRKIDPSAGLNIEETKAWRLGFILSVDIPITHFYTK